MYCHAIITIILKLSFHVYMVNLSHLMAACPAAQLCATLLYSSLVSGSLLVTSSHVFLGLSLVLYLSLQKIYHISPILILSFHVAQPTESTTAVIS